MQFNVQLFEVQKDAPRDELPKKVKTFSVQANSIDQARKVATQRVKDEKRDIRVCSFLKDGGLAIVAFPPLESKKKSGR